MRADLPGATAPAACYPTMLEDAGFEMVAEKVLTLVLDAPVDARARRFARECLLRTRVQLEPDASAADLEALDVLVDEDAGEGIMRRDDLLLTASRHLHVAGAMQ